MITRLVITPWNGKNDNLLDECKNSVKESGIEHLVVPCGTDWELQMYNLRNNADYVAWVDADDIVYPGALQKAFSLAEETGAGLIYTNELLIDKTGKDFCRTEGKCTLLEICSKPMNAHHLSITRKDSISLRVLGLYERTQCPLDWAMRVDAAINYGHRHCDIIGYGYRFHGNQIISNPNFHSKFQANYKEIITTFRSWAWPDGIVRLSD